VVAGSWAAQPFLEGLVESLHLAAGLGVIRGGMSQLDSEASQFDLEGYSAATPVGGGEHGAVVGKHRRR
jgi:hypothetical protein